jgi:hypothetical protein
MGKFLRSDIPISEAEHLWTGIEDQDDFVRRDGLQDFGKSPRLVVPQRRTDHDQTTAGRPNGVGNDGASGDGERPRISGCHDEV